jgi:WD40 repeat protein
MFARSHSSVDDPDQGRELGTQFRCKRGGIRTSLASPLLAIFVLTFVILPLVWPGIDDKGLDPSARAVFDLAADVTSVAMSSDGEHLAATSRDCPIWVWEQGDKANWSQIILPEHRPGGSRCLAVSPDGKTLAVGNMDGTITLWNSATGEVLDSFLASKEMILGLAFSADGTVLASASADSPIYVWDVASRERRATLKGHHGLVTALALAPDGRTLVSGGEDQTVRVWDLSDPENPAVFHSKGEAVLAVAISPDGRLVASASLCDNGIRLWDVRERRSRGFLPAQVATSTCLAFTSDCQTLIVGDEGGCVSLWNLFKFEQRSRFSAHTGWVKCLALAPTQGALLTGGNDGKVRLWNLAEFSRSHQPNT